MPFKQFTMTAVREGTPRWGYYDARVDGRVYEIARDDVEYEAYVYATLTFSEGSTDMPFRRGDN